MNIHICYLTGKDLPRRLANAWYHKTDADAYAAQYALDHQRLCDAEGAYAAAQQNAVTAGADVATHPQVVQARAEVGKARANGKTELVPGYSHCEVATLPVFKASPQITGGITAWAADAVPGVYFGRLADGRDAIRLFTTLVYATGPVPWSCEWTNYPKGSFTGTMEQAKAYCEDAYLRQDGTV